MVNLFRGFFSVYVCFFIQIDAGLASACIVRAVCGQCTFSTVFALISNSVPPNMMGAANGLGQSLVAFTRSLGPVVAGML